MPRSRDLSDLELEKLTTLIKMGTFTNISIAKQLAISEFTVRYHKKRVVNEGNTYKKPRSGRKRILSERGVNLLKQLSLDNKFLASNDLSKELVKAGEPKVSGHTVRRLLRENNTEKLLKNSSRCVVKMQSIDMKDRNEKKTVSAPGESEASTSTSDVDPVWQRGLKDAPSESEASTSDVDPTWQRGLQDEVENAVDPSSAEMMDTSNAIYLKEEYKEPTELYCTEYLNNNDIESEFNNSVSNEHIENKIEDNSTLLRTIPTGDNSSLLRTVPIGDNSSLLRTVPTPTQSHLISNSVDTFSEKVPKADNNPEDEFEAFGKYVAMSLRNMPTSNALSVENQIYSAINNEKRLILLQKNKSGLNIGVGVKIEVEEEPI